MFKVWILAVGEKNWNTNGLDFGTIDAANQYGRDLLSRWFGADKFVVLPKNDDFVGSLSQDVIDKNKV